MSTNQSQKNMIEKSKEKPMDVNLSSMSCSSFSRIRLMLLFFSSLTFLCST